MKAVPSKLVKVIFPKTQEKWYKKLTEIIEHKQAQEEKFRVQQAEMEESTTG